MENNELNKLVEIFLNKDSSHGELFDASRNLGSLFAKFSNISTSDSHVYSQDSSHTNLSSGVALSPLDAAICINEYMRTTKYMRGVYDALNDLLDRFKDEKVHLLYAGTGPYATLVSPLLHLFDSKRLEVTFLDIHQNSLDSVKNILAGFGKSDFAKDYICTDATTYKCDTKVHMMVTETMRLAFEGEPQVNITLNLLPQLSPDGVFIPESVNIHLESALKKLAVEEKAIKNINKSDFIADIIKLDTKKQWNKENLILNPSVEIKQEIKEGYELFLCTQIKVYKDHILNENECSLNLPYKVQLTEKLSKGDILEFSYEFENRPEILYKHKNVDNQSFLESKNFYPIEVSYRYKDSMVIVQELIPNRFLRTNFDNRMRSSEKKHISWQELENIAEDCESIEPKGFIFHSSRAGSTTLSNALSSLEKNIVIKDSSLIHDILTLDYKEDISKEEIKKRLKMAIKVLSRKRFDFEKNLYIKFNSWEISYVDTLRELYPNIPVVILYDDPQNIITSHKRKPGMHMVPHILEGKLFEDISKETAFEDYPFRVLENIFQEILCQKDKKDVLIISNNEIRDMFFSKIAPFFSLDLNEKEKRKIDFYFESLNSKVENIGSKVSDMLISNKLKDSFSLLEEQKVTHGC